MCAAGIDSDELLLKLLESLPGMAALHQPVFDAEGHIVDFNVLYLNPGAQEQFGLPAQPRQTMRQAFPNSLLNGSYAFLLKVWASDQPCYFTQHYPQHTRVPVLHMQGQRVGPVLLVLEHLPASPLQEELRYFTEQQQARTQQLETSLLKTQHLFNLDKQEHRLLSRVLDQLPAGVAVLKGPDLSFRFVNASYQVLIEGRAQLGRPIAACLPEIEEQGFVELLNRVYATGESYVGLNTPVRLLEAATNTLELHYFDFSYQALRNSEQQVSGILIFATDVTAHELARQQTHQLGESLASANEELRKANARLLHHNTDLDTFVNVASHDLRTPIVNIAGLLDVLRDELPVDVLGRGPVSQVLSLLGQSVDRFQQTLTYLTELAELQPDALPSVSPLELAALVDNVCLDLAPQLTASQGRIGITIEECTHLPYPAKHLRSIVYNLLSNAIKYRRPDHPPLIDFYATCTKGAAVIRVQDNGLGLTSAQQGRLFGLFQRLHSHVEGKGLGLYAVKKLVENAGGHIAVRSQPGEGSTFTITLPLPLDD
ncbi:hypothetical protein GCM10027345_03550 [Hymenobacter daeguensis]